MEKCGERYGKVCWGVGVRGRFERGVGKCVGVPHASPTLPHISFHLPYTPTHFSTLPHAPPSPLISPTPQHISLRLSPHLPLPPPHPNALFHTSPNTSPHLSPHLPPSIPTLTHSILSILTSYTIPHFKKIMLKCCYIRFEPEKYIGSVVPMPPVKSVKKNKIQYASNA